MTTEVCIVAFRNEPTIAACIRSLSLIPQVSVALCDNEPEATTAPAAERAAAALGIPYRQLLRPDNPGFGTACNALGRTSNADNLLFLNPDALVASWPFGDGRLQDRIVGASIRSPLGKAERTYGTSRSLVWEVLLRLQVRPRSPLLHGYVTGAAILIDRPLFLEIGGFDEAFFMYYEDIDFCLRAGLAGATIELNPAFNVVHIGGASAATDLRRASLRSYESARYFHKKWGHSARAFDAIVVLDTSARLLLARFAPRRTRWAALRETRCQAFKNLRMNT